MKKLLLSVMLFLFGLTTSLNAQSVEVVIGSGDDYVHCESPTALFYNYSFSQMIYTADEINQENGFIASIAFRMHDNSYVRNFAIYMQNTDKESFANDRDYVAVSSEDLVFEGSVNLGSSSNGWVTIELTTPFKYNGGNLLVTLDDNTGNYENDLYFYHYPASADLKRTISAYGDYNNLTYENAADYSDYSFNPTSKGYYIAPQVKFDMFLGDELPVIAAKPETIDFGYCANNAWTPSQNVKVTALDEALTITSVSNENTYFELSEVTTPYELTKETPLNIEVNTGNGEGEITDVITIAYGDKELEVQLNAYAYDPVANDVYEMATTIESLPFTATPDFNAIYSNYTLPGSAEKGKDVVYKIVLENGAILKASVEGANGKVVLYPADFGGKEGPMVDNYFGSSSFGVGLDNFEHVTPAGEYYIVASATEAFTLKVESEAMPLPDVASLYSPWDNDTDVTAPVYFQWYINDYTEEYQVLLGTTNPPTDILVDWTNDPETSYFLEEIAPATVFYWQVKTRNSTGVTESPVRTFTTRMAVPKNVTLTPQNIYEGEDVTVSWDAVEGDFLGYNVYLDSEKVNEEILTTTSYTFEDMEYAAGGYDVNITTMYEQGESYFSSTKTFYVCAETEVLVSVYEQDGVTPIEDVKVTLTGVDEAGNEQVYSLPTETGYRCKVYTGSYTAKAEKEGYQISEKDFVANYGETNNVSISMTEFYYPVRWIKAEEKETAVEVSWSLEALPADYEDFELGSLTARNWNNNSAYPWVITEDAYEGIYAMKSTGEGVDKAVSSIEMSVNIEEAGLVSFYHKISSETNCDFGKFYIDGKLVSSISGINDWKLEQHYVEAGEHVYKWEYEKDSLSNLALDAYFVDNIAFYKAIEAEDQWLHYDDGTFVTSIGTGQVSPVYWGIKIPNTYMYAGLDLTKVAIYDYEAATYTANIYVGGESAPATLVSSQEFETSGSKNILEVNLSTPVAIDSDQPLWITMYCDELTYPAPACAQQETEYGDLISLDGTTWEHSAVYGLAYTWILRGYVEDAEGNTRMLANNNIAFDGGASTGTFVANNDVKAVFVGTPQRNSANRAFTSKYNVYKRNLFSQEEILVAENTTEATYTDETWATAETGAYQWGASALYEGNRGPKVVFSEDFEEGVMPYGWTVYNEDISGNGSDPSDNQDWTVGSVCYNLMGEEYASNGSQYFAYSPALYYANIERFYLVTPQMKLAPNTVLSFEYMNPSIWGSYFSKFAVAVSSSPTGPWTDVYATADYEETASWTAAQINLADYAGQDVYVAFIHQFGYGYGSLTAIDDVVFSADSPESEIVWSNVVSKNMSTKVTVNAATNSGDPVVGAKVTFQNLVEPRYSYATNLDEKGTCVIEDFRKGEYKLTVELEGFNSSYESKEVSIWDETTFACELTEKLSPVSDLYVSPTGYAMWKGGSAGDKGDEFSYDFEDGTLNGWVTIDADGDGFTWENFKDSFADETGGSGHNGTYGGALSYSYVNSYGPLTPDNYLVTDKTYKIGANSQLRFYVCGLDENYAEEHYGVAISTVSNTSADDFVTIFEETLTAKSGKVRSAKDKNTRATRAGNYYEKVIDLSEYEGQSIYIAFRHFNITDMFAVCVDDISLENASNSRALQSYKVYLNGGLLTDKLTDTYYQFENLVEGQEYTTTIVPVYTTADGVESTYTWTYKACDKFEGVKDFKAELINDEVIVSWTLPQTEVVGVNLYRNDQLVKGLVKGEQYIDKEATKGDEISLVLVLGGEKDVTYYAMTCPQTTTVIYNMPCESPKNLHAYNTINEDGTFGATLVWPYTEVKSEWLHYDDGQLIDGIGGPSHFYWGIMFPASKLEAYAGASLTKVATYIRNSDAADGMIHIYYGGTYAPEMIIHTQDFAATTSEEYVEFNLTYPLPISGEENIWVVLETSNGTSYPAAGSADCGDPNSRWISVDGATWEDAADSGLNITWMIRAYVSVDGRGTVALDENTNRAPALKNYNIYRGTSLDNIEKVAETTNRRYFDQVAEGKYYYQVKAVYEEFGETCESEAANSYSNPDQDYVVVEVSEINENGVNGLMIYPNPTNGNLNIQVEAMRRITIANALGQIVYDQEVDSDNTIIDMTQYESGIYMVQIVTDNGVATKRVSVL